MTEGEFREMVSAAIDELPAFFRSRMDNVFVVVEPAATREVLAGQGLSDPMSLLGLYEGCPVPTRGAGYTNVLPDRITLYRRPILAGCRSPEEARRRLRGVFIHEVGHHFGFSESELRRLERQAGER